MSEKCFVNPVFILLTYYCSWFFMVLPTLAQGSFDTFIEIIHFCGKTCLILTGMLILKFVSDQFLSFMSSWTTYRWWRVWNVQERKTESKTERSRITNSTQFHVFLTLDIKCGNKVQGNFSTIMIILQVCANWCTC